MSNINGKMLIDMKIEEIADFYGFENQSEMLMEECAELIQAVNKYKRSPDSITYNDLAEEIADVEIMIAQIKHLTNMNNDYIKVTKEHKLNRQLTRIKNLVGGVQNG